MSSIIKVFSVIAGISTLGGVTVSGYYAFSNNNNIVSKQLEKEGFTILNSDNDFATLLTKYKSAQKDIFQENKENINLKHKCEAILNETLNENNYKLARKWCVKEENINKILENAGYKILNSAEDTTNDNAIWENKVQLLKKDLNKFSSVKDKIKTPEEETGNNIKALKAACKALSIENTQTTNDKFGENFDLSKEFCAIKKDARN